MIVAVDTGQSGAIAFMDNDGTLVGIEDMPVDKVTVGKFSRSRVSDIRLLAILDGARGAHAFLERPEGRPIRFRDKQTGESKSRTPGAAGMLSMGEAFGIARCAITASGLALTEVRPGVWKREIGLPADKNECRRRAAELFPNFAEQFALVKHDGKAESCLLALYGYRVLYGGLKRKAA